MRVLYKRLIRNFLKIKKGPLVLIKNIVITELLMALFMLATVSLINYQSFYEKSLLSQFIRYDYSLVIIASILQLTATVAVFWRWHSRHFGKRLSIFDLILRGESHRLELKRTFRWDEKQKILNKDLEKAVFKTIAGFLNSEGGKIIIGVSDDKLILGLADDYKTLARKDKDGFENHFSQMFNNVIGAKFRRFIKVSFETLDNKDLCLVEVSPGDEPAYVSLNNIEEFYVRAGNTTSPLPVSKAADYIKSRWK